MGKIKLSLTPIIITYLICTCICIIEFGIDECLRVSVLCFFMSCLLMFAIACICIAILYIKTTRDEFKENKYIEEKDLFVDMGIDKRPVLEQLDEVFGKKKK